MIIEKANRRSRYYDEDRTIIGDNYAMVCDGATSLVKTNIKPTEASWFVSLIKKKLPKRSNNIIEDLASISKYAYSEYEYKDLKYLPSCGIAAVSFNNDLITINTIGDCEAIIKFKNGKIERMLIEALPKLDMMVINEMKRISNDKKIPLLDTYNEVKPMLLENRMLMNKENGYPVFTISDNPDFKYNNKSYNKNDIDEIYIFTDGFAQAYEFFNIYSSYDEMFKKSLNLQEEIDKIVNVAFSDKSCDKFPRFKTIDDIAVIKIKF